MFSLSSSLSKHKRCHPSSRQTNVRAAGHQDFRIAGHQDTGSLNLEHIEHPVRLGRWYYD